MAKNKQRQKWLKQIKSGIADHDYSETVVNQIVNDNQALIDAEYQKHTPASSVINALLNKAAENSKYVKTTAKASEKSNAESVKEEQATKVAKADQSDTKKQAEQSDDKSPTANKPAKTVSVPVNNKTPVAKGRNVAVKVIFGVLLGAVLGCGVTSWYLTHGTTDNSQVVMHVNNKPFTSNDLVKLTGDKDYSGQLLNAYKMDVMAKALNDKYGTKEFKPTVDKEISYIQKRSGGDMQLALQQYQVNSLPQLRQRLYFQLQMQKYVESKITTKDLQNAYKDYLPNQKFSYIGFADAKSAKNALAHFKKVGYKKFAKENKKGLYDVTLNSVDSGLRKGQFTKIGNLKVHDAGLAQTQSGQYLLLIKMQSAKKGSYDSVKDQLRTAAKQEKLSDPNLTKNFIKDFNIKSNSKTGDDIIKAMKSTKSNSNN